ncbi:MAG: hypothetical protein KAQ70_05740, partial [Candidatus Heimdallarchaeota archaeon]|nr:hypothetical protein [Candidatus Heimdallarchaeota archaeon]
ATDAPISDIKYTVSQIFGLPPDEFHLSHAGRTCDNDDVLEDYGVEDGDTVLLNPSFNSRLIDIFNEDSN